ncbi:hypothetical protein BATDEDRAFT_85723 [Batrachochytrium dendrobatidis JAM81]|uniref:Cation/H+ exchanger transmembrane domain-containing protein n=1 Tax=Batrachochytrium dendrobatidis (strain JAM81 / FGSC 10211) TaxID=684364 RepID=F4NSL1_BATDJ|nr:uncharacterized protein BATDEDRAFT_85723 [Batrachochytrium dendrobatidis JAM81]EGF83042.1 hypothetical protein BATDEDRAFT_85723 [Batrachochytrium dendrobatidis JAM81]|eukprot:XP_006675959.1 hypothetical protein BATDEDRAFT_85723 [Batrachochytrium dendrobatidis JAM81]
MHFSWATVVLVAAAYQLTVAVAPYTIPGSSITVTDNSNTRPLKSSPKPVFPQKELKPAQTPANAIGFKQDHIDPKKHTSAPLSGQIKKESLSSIDEKPLAKLDSFDIDSVIQQRERLIQQVNQEKDRLEWENENGRNDGAIELINTRIKRITLLEDVIRSSLDIYKEIVQNQNVSTIDRMMEKESLMIVNEFQKLVLRAKNDHLAIQETKKEADKNTKLKQSQDPASPHSPLSGSNSPTETPVIGKAASKIVENVIDGVSKEADKLESSLKGDSFIESQKSEGTTVETVLKVQDTSKGSGNSTIPSHNEPDAPTLIDSHNNQYVLSKSGDTTAHVEGVLLGPPGYIKNAVQVETIARGLGVIFIMIFLGLEFNITKIKKVWTVSIGGSALLLFLTELCVVFIGNKFGSRPSESLVVGASLFLSSTVVVLNFMKAGEVETQYGRNILGVLIAQDVLLGFFLALMPALKSSGTDAVYTVCILCLSLAGFLCTCLILYFPAICMLQWLLPTSESGQEIYLLSSIGFCLIIIQVGSYFGQSMELCCFVAGVMISTRKSLGNATAHVAEPLRGMFAALFFASIGLHIYPSFLLNEGLLLISLTFLVVAIKIALAIVVFKAVFRFSWSTSMTVAIGLGQMSEFTFVLASKAKSLDLVTRETFYIMLGVTTLSMVASPALWYLGGYLDGRRSKSELVLKKEKKPESDDELQVLIE